MKLMANENIPRASVEFLRDAGHDVVSIGDDFAGVTDEEVVALATEEDRLIVTFDRDYGELIFKHGFQPPAGVLYLRIEEFSPDEPGQIVAELLAEGVMDLAGALTVLDRAGIRQRRYVAPPSD